MQLRPKLIQACKGLGLNLLEISQFVQINDYPNIACWGYDLERKEHFIYINPKVLKLPVEHIRLILKHEILHYAGYKNLEYARDFVRSNIAYDIVVNKVLTMANERAMKALCRRIYPPESKNNILALARPDVNPDELKENKKFWLSIWDNYDVPSPTSIYYNLVSPVKIKNNPFHAKVLVTDKIIFRKIPDGANGSKFGKLSERTVNEITREILGHGFSSAKFSEVFQKIFVNKTSFDSSSVEEFISRLESRNKLEDACSRIISALDSRSTRQLYPYQLSRIGLVYMACGINSVVPVYLNKTPEGKKSKLAIYVDTSPSMECYQGKEIFLIDRLRSYFPTKIHCFSHDVKEISLDDFSNGNYDEGFSTSFDAVIEHLLESEYEAGAVFTDGYSEITSQNKKNFKQNRKRLFAVYFSSNGTIESDLDNLAEQTMTINVD